MHLYDINFTIVGQIPVVEYVMHYGHKIDHRNNAPGKAQWHISEVEERAIFKTAMAHQWIENSFAYSVYAPNGVIGYLGVDRDHQADLFIARFDEHRAAEWHGYPCNYKEPQQRPSPHVLAEWLRLEVLSKAQIRKITLGQRCSI